MSPSHIPQQAALTNQRFLGCTREMCSRGSLAEERGDAVTDLPVHDDLELVLQASEMTAAAPPSTSGAPVITQLRPMHANSAYPFAMENSVLNLEAAYDELRGKMAMSFPFELDRFQKEGVLLMEAGESVFVAAHTSAGACRRCSVATGSIETLLHVEFNRYPGLGHGNVTAISACTAQFCAVAERCRRSAVPRCRQDGASRVRVCASRAAQDQGGLHGAGQGD
jgi:hypothetical protein